jgi:hypothetical protein
MFCCRYYISATDPLSELFPFNLISNLNYLVDLCRSNLNYLVDLCRTVGDTPTEDSLKSDLAVL